MRKYLLFLLSLGCLQQLSAQNQPHYTMFMYNKLIYNPAYAGSRDALSLNASYRNQWSGIDGAPETGLVSVDAPVGKSTALFNKVALGLYINSEKTGPVTNNTVMANYAYRIQMRRSVISFGLSAGASIYSYNARYDGLKLQDSTDQLLLNSISGHLLPNIGFGVYWYSNRGYIGLSVPSLLQNYYDKNQKNYTAGSDAKQIRAFYASAGYTLKVDDNFALLPQVLTRYYHGGGYSLPFTADLNLTAIIYKRVMFGATYRTDKSIEGIVHIQVAQRLNIGYAYDYLLSDYKSYVHNTHEVVVGFDFIKDKKQYEDPRFIKNF